MGTFRSVLCIILTLFALNIVPSAECRAETEEALKKDFPGLTKRISATQPADFIIAVDKSGSMKPYWPTVKKALAAFIRAIPDNDYVSLIIFGTESGYLATPTPINESTRNHLISEIESISAPIDQNTDLGKAFEKVLHEANRPTGNKLKFVFFLTDFNHDAARTSPYFQKRNPGDEVWKKLADRRASEQKNNIVQAYALLLPLEKNVGKDIALGKSIFPELESVSVNQSTLLAWFERRKAEIARDKLRALVKNDYDNIGFTLTGLEYEKSSFDKTGKVLARLSQAKTQIVEVAGIRDVKFGITLDNTLLPAGTTMKETPHAKEIQLGKKGDIIIDAGVFSYDTKPLLKRTVTTNAMVSFTGSVTLAPADELAKLGLPQSLPAKATATLPLRITYGQISPVTLILIGAVILLVICAVLYYFRPEHVVGRLSIPGVGTYEIKKNRKATLVTVGDVPPETGFQVPGARWKLDLKGFRPFEEGKRKRGIYGRMSSVNVATVTYRNKTESITNLTWVWIERNSTTIVENSRITFS